MTVCLIKMMWQPTEKQPLQGGGALKKQPRDVGTLVLERPGEDKKRMLEIRGDSNTIVDWVHGRAKLKTWESTVATAQNPVREWWGRGVNLRRRVTDWAAHIFRKHNGEADFWAGKGVKRSSGRVIPRMWCGPKLPACAGFGTAGVSEARAVQGIMIQVFTKTLWWATSHKECGPAPGRNPLDAELGGCAVLMKNLGQWTDKSMRERWVLRCLSLSPARSNFRRNALQGAPLPSPFTPPLGLWVACGWGVRGFAVQGDGEGSGIQSVKRHRIGRGQYAQGGWLARSRSVSGSLRTFHQRHNGKKYFSAPC